MKSLLKFIKPLRLYLFNVFINKIPFSNIRIPFMRFYFMIGKESNVCHNTKLLYGGLLKSQIRIGNNCVINPDCILDGRQGRIVIKDNVDVARGTWIFTLQHDPHSDYHSTKHGDVIIEENVWIASRCIILPGVTIGRGSVVACGSVVTKDVPPMSIVGGIPAKVIGLRKSKMLYRNKHFPYFYT